MFTKYLLNKHSEVKQKKVDLNKTKNNKGKIIDLRLIVDA